MNTSKSEHTPGPWKVLRHESGNDIQNGLAGYSIQSTRESHEGIAYNICREANARLIAAAPDLLVALQAIAHMNVTETSNHAEVLAICMAIARNEIAKARE